VLRSASLGPRADIALLVLRLVLGVAFVLHGLPKVQEPLTWGARMVPWAPGWLQAFVAFVEVGGGIAVLAGFLTPVFAFLISCDMIVAIFFVLVPRGATFVAGGSKPSFEVPLAYLAMAVTLILIGPGAYAADAGRSGGRVRSKRR
jgi:putative oxidoreductase